MNATQGRDEATGVVRTRLRRGYYEDLARRRGVQTLDQRAELFGLHRSTVARIQESQIEPRLGAAMNIAHRLGTTVDALWLRRGEGDLT